MISSRNNSEITEVSKLKQKKYRDSSNQYLIEGIKLLKEALNNKADIQKIYATSDILNKFNLPEEFNITEVTDKVFDKISTQKNPEGIIAVIKKSAHEFKNEKRVLLLDNIQDPGNLGTIIRTADAAGFKTVFCSSDCADLYNEKTIRATMGSIFHVKILTNQNLSKVLNKLNNESYETVAAVLDGKKLNSNSLQNPKNLALIVGNESHGIKSDLVKLCKKRIALPMIGKAESLNVAIAAGIFMYAFVLNENN